MYDHMLHRGREHFCCHCLQAFSTKKILKRHTNDCFKINSIQKNKLPKKNYKRNTKSSFMISADFESIFVPEDNEKQNTDAFYTYN